MLCIVPEHTECSVDVLILKLCASPGAGEGSNAPRIAEG